MVATYGKLFKVCTDFGAGIAYVNSLAQNFEAQATAMALEHGTVEQGWAGGVGSPPGDRRKALGHHSTQKIPRSVAQYQYENITPSRYQPRLATPDFHAISVTRQATGLLFVAVKGLTSWWSTEPVPYVTSTSTVRWVVPSSYYPAAAPDAAGIAFASYELSAGDFVLTDFNFSFAIYGT